MAGQSHGTLDIQQSTEKLETDYRSELKREGRKIGQRSQEASVRAFNWQPKEIRENGVRPPKGHVVHAVFLRDGRPHGR